MRDALQKTANVDDLFGLWRQNVDTVRSLHRLSRGHSGSGGIDGISLVAHLKACARRLGDTIKIPESENTESKHSVPPSPRLPARIDKSVLTISEPQRIRSKEHLRFVAQQPCLICGRNPSHAHHVRFAQPRGLALKVSDEFTVPLCAIHHSENHATGDERRWWQEHKIDPLVVAAQLWTSDMEGGSAPRL